jgi:hypothetical protein
VNRTTVLLKLAAVSSSVLLVAGCISYQTGAFDRLLASKRPTDPQSSPNGEQATEGKSTAATNPSSPPAPTQSEPAILPGPKSFYPRPLLGLTPAEQPPATPQPDPTVMGSSKSGFIRPVPKELP